jgi:hypothetical protein
MSTTSRFLKETGRCEPAFVTAQGTPLTRFRRAIETRSILLAELAAREAGRLPLEDTLALVALYARLDDDKFERAAVRWLARYALERRPTLGEVQLAVAALATFTVDGERALRLLRELKQ